MSRRFITGIARNGSTLKAFAANNDYDVDELLALNPHIAGATVSVRGDALRLPSALPAPTQAPATTEALVAKTAVPAWYAVAQAEQKLGVREIAGKRHNPRILEYHATTTLQANDDETAWCSSFVNWSFKQVAIVGTRSSVARSWERWGDRIATPRIGCVAVLWRLRADSWQGHVGFYAGESANGILLLGGNQGQRLGYQSFPKRRLLSYRWPKGR